MSFGKEFLLSCIVMMHVYFLVSHPIDVLTNDMKEFELPLCNLRHAENDYVRYMFGDHSSKDNKTNNCKSLEGITFPRKNHIGEAVAFMVNISNCIDILPAIIKNLTITRGPTLDYMISNITVFHESFKAVLVHNGQNVTTKECHANVTGKTDYQKKLIGLRIICNTRRWVERYTSCISMEFKE